MRQFEEESMELVIRGISDSMNDLILRSNSSTSALYNTLYRSTTDLQTIKKKVAILGDMLTDLNVISGKTKNLIYLSDLDIVSKKGIDIDNGKITLGKLKEQQVEFSVKTSTILSDKPYTISDQTGRSKGIEDVFKYSTPTELKINSVGYDFTYILNYSKTSKINQIVIELPPATDSYPLVENISIIGKDGISEVPVKILNSNSYNYSLDENRSMNNIYAIDIETVDTASIKFSLSSKIDDHLQIQNIRTNFNTYETSGEIIFGPIISEHSILKVGMSCIESSENVLLQLSTDLDEWIDVTDSFRVSLDDVRKIVAFNTINEASFKTSDDIKRLYVKVTLAAQQLDTVLSTIETYDNYREDGIVSNSLALDTTTPSNRFSAFRLKTDDLYYGGHTYNTGLEVGKKLRANISTVMLNGETQVLGFDKTPYSLGLSDSLYNNIDIKMNPLRLPASRDIDASVFDSVGSTLFDINVIPFKEDINVLTKDDICFKLVGKEDTYKIVAKESKRYLELDITSNFIQDSSSAILQVPYEDIVILNSLGEAIKEFDKDSLIFLGKEDEKVFFISLLDVLYIPPSIENYTCNPLFPLEANATNQFGLDNGRIILGRGSIVTVNGFKIIKNKINTKLDVSYQNGNIWERLDTLYTYHNEQIDRQNKETTVIKLDHRSIEKGSLKIFEYSEYDTIGNEENVYISTANSYIKENGYLTEEKNSNIYIKE